MAAPAGGPAAAAPAHHLLLVVVLRGPLLVVILRGYISTLTCNIIYPRNNIYPRLAEAAPVCEVPPVVVDLAAPEPVQRHAPHARPAHAGAPAAHGVPVAGRPPDQSEVSTVASSQPITAHLAASTGLLSFPLVALPSSMATSVSMLRSTVQSGTCTSPIASSLEKVSLSYTWNTIVFFLTSLGDSYETRVSKPTKKYLI